MLAPEIDHPVPVRLDAPFAISAHADYGWETVGPAGMDPEAGGDTGAATEAQDRPDPAEAAAPFQLRDIGIDIPRGAFVVICGKVGSGKSSLVQALIGEMKMLKGESYLGGSTSYCTSTISASVPLRLDLTSPPSLQSPASALGPVSPLNPHCACPLNPFLMMPSTAPLRNATLRDNILFGDTDVNEARFQEAVKSCALEPDIAMRQSSRHRYPLSGRFKADRRFFFASHARPRD